MRFFVKKISLLINLLLLTSLLFGQAAKKADRDTEQWRYEIECVATGAEGSFLVKVWSYSKKPAVAIEQAKKNAVHGIIFKGFSGAGAGCSQQPLVSDPAIEQASQQFFEDFFADGGKYMKFVNVSTDGMISPEDRLKIGKEYKIGVIVSVLKDNLRKELEAAGIIKALGGNLF